MIGSDQRRSIQISVICVPHFQNRLHDRLIPIAVNYHHQRWWLE